MKEYINQIYDEGLGYTFYKPLEKKLKKIKNKNIKKTLIVLTKVIYGILVLGIAIVIAYVKYPFK